MLLPLVALLLLAQGESYWARRELLRQEDLTAVKAEFQKRDPTLEHFEVLDKRPIDGTYAVLIAHAAPMERSPQWPKPTMDYRRGERGVFVVVAGQQNRIHMVLDRYPARAHDLLPSMEPPTVNVTYLHAYSDYGLYVGSTKYTYDLHTRRKATKIGYLQMALKASAWGGKRLYYAAAKGNAWPQQYQALVTVEPRLSAVPVFEVRPLNGREPEALVPALGRKPATKFDLGGGRSLALVQTESGPGYDSVAYDVPDRNTENYTVPIPGMDLYMKVRVPVDPLLRRYPSQRPNTITNQIGPFAMDGSMLWFTTTFYDGEGSSSLGAIGTFDARTRKYEMRYLPEIARWSGSALRLDGDDVWVGLAHHPEGAVYGGGLLRYNRKTRAVRTYPVNDLIYTIDRAGDALYLGTSHGLYMLRSETLTQYRFEPDEGGRIHVVARHEVVAHAR
jgi:hypothetical protein